MNRLPFIAAALACGGLYIPPNTFVLEKLQHTNRYTPQNRGQTWQPKKKRNRKGRDPFGKSGYLS